MQTALETLQNRTLQNQREVIFIYPTPLPPGLDRFKQFPTPGPKGWTYPGGCQGRTVTSQIEYYA